MAVLLNVTNVLVFIQEGGDKMPNLERISELSALAPLHNPAHVVGIKAFQKALPNVFQIVVFDTAFHQTMSQDAYMYAVPYEWYQNHKVRRYGAHGTSHQFVANRCAELMGKPIEELKIVTLHIGNGASLAAVKGGKFAQICEPAHIFSIVLSDVLGDPLDMIASGPAYPDSTTSNQAKAIAKLWAKTEIPVRMTSTTQSPNYEIAYPFAYNSGDYKSGSGAAPNSEEYKCKIIDTNTFVFARRKKMNQSSYYCCFTCTRTTCYYTYIIIINLFYCLYLFF